MTANDISKCDLDYCNNYPDLRMLFVVEMIVLQPNTLKNVVIIGLNMEKMKKEQNFQS